MTQIQNIWAKIGFFFLVLEDEGVHERFCFYLILSRYWEEMVDKHSLKLKFMRGLQRHKVCPTPPPIFLPSKKLELVI